MVTDKIVDPINGDFIYAHLNCIQWTHLSMDVNDFGLPKYLNNLKLLSISSIVHQPKIRKQSTTLSKQSKT